MRAALPLYEGDSLIHYASDATTAGGRDLAFPGLSWTAVTDSIAGFFRAIDRSIERARCRELERYLANATDLCDLERRIRDVERANGYPFSTGY